MVLAGRHSSRMTTPLARSEWAADRGAKWNAHVAGLEAMLRPIDEPSNGREALWAFGE